VGDALSAHRSIVRDAVMTCGGEEVGTEGDSFFVVFASAHEAVRAAVTAQRELQAYRASRILRPPDAVGRP
jgi:class 3 adenylate cyclase